MQVILFTKANCQLCDAIKHELLDLRAEFEFDLIEEFVETNSDASQKGQPHVPFVHIEREGKIIRHLAYPVKQVELRRAVRTETKSRSERRV